MIKMMSKTCASVTRAFGARVAPARGKAASVRIPAQTLDASRSLLAGRRFGSRSANVVMAAVPANLPNVDFRVRVRDESIGGDNPFTWKTFTSEDYFKGKKVVLFSLPGAFTPTCSTYQLPGFEKNAEEFKKLGIDEIYCLSVNDSFVMNKWAQDQGLEAVKVIPDGSLAFTNAMDMNVQKDNHAFGQRSWRYAVVADDMKIVQTFIEPGKCDNGSVDDDPYGASSPENILKYLKGEDFDAGA